MDVEKVIAEALFGEMSTAWTCEDGAKHVMSALTTNGLTVVPNELVEALRGAVASVEMPTGIGIGGFGLEFRYPEWVSVARAALAKLDQLQ